MRWAIESNETELVDIKNLWIEGHTPNTYEEVVRCVVDDVRWGESEVIKEFDSKDKAIEYFKTNFPKGGETPKHKFTCTCVNVVRYDDAGNWEIVDAMITDVQEFKPWYAVQIGDDDAWDDGSYDYGEALEMARKKHAEASYAEIRIATIDEYWNVCDREEVIYEESYE